LLVPSEGSASTKHTLNVKYIYFKIFNIFMSLILNLVNFIKRMVFYYMVSCVLYYRQLRLIAYQLNT